MAEQLVAFFMSWFANPSVLGIGLAIVFGTIWLAGHWPPLFKNEWLWAVLVSSAVLLKSGLFTVVHLEIYAAVVAILVTGGALWLRWRKPTVAAEV